MSRDLLQSTASSENVDLSSSQMSETSAKPTEEVVKIFTVIFTCWYGHVLRKDDDDWVKKCMEHEVEGPRPRGRPKKSWKEVVREDCQARKLNKEDAMDRCKWRKMIKEAQ